MSKNLLYVQDVPCIVVQRCSLEVAERLEACFQQFRVVKFPRNGFSSLKEVARPAPETLATCFAENIMCAQAVI